MTVLTCQGTDGVKGSTQVKWYDMTDGGMPNFVSCETCFQDIILATNFLTEIQSMRTNPQ